MATNWKLNHIKNISQELIETDMDPEYFRSAVMDILKSLSPKELMKVAHCFDDSLDCGD